MSVKYLALMLLLPLALVGGRAVAAAADHHVSTFHGTVTKTAPDHHWLQVRTRANKVIRFQTPRATSWQGCARDEAHHGHAVTISAYKKAGAWVATTVRGQHPACHHDQHQDQHTDHDQHHDQHH